MVTFGSRLRELRSSMRITQKELADKFQISESAVGMYERDEREPSFDLLNSFATFFEVSADYIHGRSSIRKPTDQHNDAEKSERIYLKMIDDFENCRVPGWSKERSKQMAEQMRFQYEQNKREQAKMNTNDDN